MGRRKVVYSVFSEETEFGVQFGIVCEVNGRPYSSIGGISPNRASVENLAFRCNAWELSENQFRDVVEDSLL